MYCLQTPPDYTQYRNVYQDSPSVVMFKLQDQGMTLISQKAFLCSNKAFYPGLGLKTPETYSLNTQRRDSKEKYIVVSSHALTCNQKNRPQGKVTDFYSCVPSRFLMTFITITARVLCVMMAVWFNEFWHCYFLLLFMRTGALRNGCSFEDDLSLGAEGQ